MARSKRNSAGDPAAVPAGRAPISYLDHHGRPESLYGIHRVPMRSPAFDSTALLHLLDQCADADFKEGKRVASRVSNIVWERGVIIRGELHPDEIVRVAQPVTMTVAMDPQQYGLTLLICSQCAPLEGDDREQRMASASRPRYCSHIAALVLAARDLAYENFVLVSRAVTNLEDEDAAAAAAGLPPPNRIDRNLPAIVDRQPKRGYARLRPDTTPPSPAALEAALTFKRS